MQEIEVGTYVDAMTEVRVGQHGVTGCKKNVAAMLDMPCGAAIHDEVKGVVAGARHVCIVPKRPVLGARLVNDRQWPQVHGGEPRRKRCPRVALELHGCERGRQRFGEIVEALRPRNIVRRPMEEAGRTKVFHLLPLAERDGICLRAQQEHWVGGFDAGVRGAGQEHRVFIGFRIACEA